jgi:hypothetical protein
MQVDSAGLLVVRRPAGEAREEMALADAGFAPQNNADATAKLQGLPCQANQTLERRAMDAVYIHTIAKEVGDTIVDKRIRRAHQGKQRFHVVHG